MQTVFLVVLFLTAVFLILLVLVQRGKGGGLAGALGGMGGQSAFGTKAGDLFTKITVGVAAFWIIMCAFIAWYLSGSRNANASKLAGKGANQPGVTQTVDKEPEGDAKGEPAGDAKAAPAPAPAPAAPKTDGDAPKK